MGGSAGRPPAPSGASTAERADAPRPRPGFFAQPGARAALSVLAVFALALVAGGAVMRGMGVPATATTTPGSVGRQAYQAYVAAYRDGGLELMPIDPHTLADLPDRPALRIPDLTFGHFTGLASADGSTIAVMQYTGALATAEDVTIRIVDARTGGERTRFRTPVPVEMQHLTADGSRLFAWGPAYRPEPQRRYVWETANGRLLAAVPEAGFWLITYDAGGQRAYGLAALDPEGSGLREATLVAQDALSGKDLGRVRLAGVLVGQEAGIPVQPWIAVSPDGGRRVAVLHAGGNALTLVDAASLRVLWTRPLTRAAGVPDRGQPPPPDGKLLRHFNWIVGFSPDGRYLYTSGVEEWTAAAGRINYRLLGLRAIAVARAEIVAETSAEPRPESFTIAPDGNALFTISPRRDAPRCSDASVLRRLDPLTLAVTAERAFPNERSLRLVFLAVRRP